ncbi:hypothetical protein GGR57DRAFT_507740 [Xylariaceae sp. FL1272]|nr:hypothetical protein GGR57DRAFT_507740 [Xylariaceae sp. FL1272]
MRGDFVLNGQQLYTLVYVLLLSYENFSDLLLDYLLAAFSVWFCMAIDEWWDPRPERVTCSFKLDPSVRYTRTGLRSLYDYRRTFWEKLPDIFDYATIMLLLFVIADLSGVAYRIDFGSDFRTVCNIIRYGFLRIVRRFSENQA